MLAQDTECVQSLCTGHYRQTTGKCDAKNFDSFCYFYTFLTFFLSLFCPLSACLVLWASLPEIKIDDDYDDDDDDSLPVEVVGFYQELRILFFTGSEMRVEAKKTHTNHNGP